MENELEIVVEVKFPTHDEIALAAYYLWLNDPANHGDDSLEVTYWLTAEKTLLEQMNNPTKE